MERTDTRWHKGILIAAACSLSIGLSACEKQGPLERAGEEVDEAVDTMKRGEESTATKVDDAIDELRE
jgi:predicted small lipoprotein YifL